MCPPPGSFIAVRGLVFLGVARAWFSWDWAVLATLFDAGRAAYVVPRLGYRWVLAWFSSWYWWVLLGVLVGIAGYCGGIGGYWSQVLMYWPLFRLGFCRKTYHGQGYWCGPRTPFIILKGGRTRPAESRGDHRPAGSKGKPPSEILEFYHGHVVRVRAVCGEPLQNAGPRPAAPRLLTFLWADQPIK